jgi:hypothetical protein
LFDGKKVVGKGCKGSTVISPGMGPAQRSAQRLKNPMPKYGPGKRSFNQRFKQRGLLEDTLVVWGGEFGRTVYSQGKLTSNNYGRDHHPRCFTMWMAGAGVKPGFTYGETDDFGYNITKDPVHVHDFHATLMHLFGIDHEKLVYKYQGRRFRLTDVSGKVVKDISDIMTIAIRKKEQQPDLLVRLTFLQNIKTSYA